ncbi:hypothetical protein EOI86_04995 [Hwanghaeella grinnelliae]|uniref:Sulfotransferase family protein n=1 Tax=Hwanghaeella grinnelliae TaxID=2500179 RepID=A0A3S2W6R9_9PROT|nr:hypothetical protein [Hwanghaeella grinnelliae]RVU38634.1 hypothetical protein EOI86_04995 [Hwanghaeella grinnelliae]
MTAWQKALEEGDPLGAAELSFAAYAGGDRDAETADFAFKAQCGTGRFEEALEILAETPTAAQSTSSFVSLLNMIAMTGATELVEKYGLFPVMEANEGTHPGISEFGVRIAAQCLRRRPDHAEARLFLHTVFPKLIAGADWNLLRCVLVPVSDADRQLMVNRIDGAFGGVPYPLVPELARFSSTAVDNLCGPDILTRPMEAVFLPQTIVWRIANGAAHMQVAEDRPASLTPPVLNRERIAANVRALQRAARDFVSTARDYPFDRYEGFGDGVLGSGAPVIVLSTGRVGTMAMEALLKRSDGLLPFHAFNLHVETGDQNAILYKLISEDPGSFERDIESILRYRFSEFAYCRAAGKIPVIVNHLDTVLAPILMGAFPDARLIRMHRAPEKTLLSLAYKNQFGYRQLRHLKSRFDKDTGEFVFRRDRSLTIEQECAWYMYVTDLLADIYRTELARPGRFLDLDMEQVFGLAAGAIRHLSDFLDDPAITPETCRDVFSQRINEKSFYTFDPVRGDLARLAAELEKAYTALEGEGGFG